VAQLPQERARLEAGALVVMPTYREADNITSSLLAVRSALPEASVLVVDDDGGDGTADLAQEAGKAMGNIRVLRRPGKSGLASAYKQGFFWGIDRGWRVLVGMDADLSHDAQALPGMLKALQEGADVAIGSRYVTGGRVINWPLARRALSRWGNWYAGHALHTRVSDLTSAFRAYRAEALGAINFEMLRADGYGFLIELAYSLERAGAKVAEVPITFVNRCAGKSKMSPKIAFESFWVVTTLGLSRYTAVAGGTARPAVAGGPRG